MSHKSTLPTRAKIERVLASLLAGEQWSAACAKAGTAPLAVLEALRAAGNQDLQDRYRRLKESQATLLVDRAQEVLEALQAIPQGDISGPQVGRAKALAEFYLSRAERQAPRDWGKFAPAEQTEGEKPILLSPDVFDSEAHREQQEKEMEAKIRARIEADRARAVA